jgi:ABC-2 type transport system permease protein
MAVYRRGYQRYEGELTGRWARFLVLPHFSWQRLLRQRLVVFLLLLSLIWPLLSAVFIYLSNHADLLTFFGPAFKRFLEVNGNFFITFMNVQAFFVVFLAALTGPGLIAPDLANNALPLYFSRPLKRLDYAIARLAALLGLLSLITWVPGLLLFGMQIGMAEKPWLSTYWKLGIGMTSGFLIWILLVSLVALASSAYVRVRVVAGGLVLGFFFILSGVSTMINGVFRDTWGYALNPAWTTHRLWYSLLSLEAPAGPGIATSIFAISIILLILILVLERKLRPVEVIS